MDKIFKNKWILTCIIFLILGITFVYILNLRPDLNLKGGYWIFSFLLTLLFYYFIFILSTILQIFLIKCFRIMPIKVFSLYPITYDGSFRFYPIRLIYNIEAFNNSLILNLALYFKDDRQLMNQMKKLLILRKISILLSISLLFLLLNRFDVKTTIVFLIAALSMILVSYFQYGAYWYGYDYLYSKGAASLKEYLLASKSIMILDSIQYADALKQEHEDEYLECSILENYLYRSILDNKSICSMDIIRAATLRQIDKIEFFRINLKIGRAHV